MDARAFDEAMGGLGPFEPEPRLAVGVSGGPDSLALALLSEDWARARGGRATALIVDHRLRPGSSREARAVAALLHGRGIEAHVLIRKGAVPETGIEAAARAARHDLLGTWCTRAGILHLLLAHHQEDQAETLLLRLAAGSGPDGLAAMPTVQETRWGRVLRPLLAVPSEALRAVARIRGLSPVDDPMNRDPAFARARLRASADVLAREGLSPARLARTAVRLGRARAALEGQTAALLARAAWVSPAGFAVLDRACLAAAPADPARRALARLLRTVGGAAYGPREERLDRLVPAIVPDRPFRARTLGGCALVALRDGRLLVAREAGLAAPARAFDAGREVFWDGRFRVRLRAGHPDRAELRLGALGEDGWAAIRKAVARNGANVAVPAHARLGLPALRDARGIVEVPHLDFVRDAGAAPRRAIESIAFAPPHPLAAAEF